ncbi:unnamed protein product [Polarella glacialis]|uniref:Uncharacterized protein n=1 Tax=Polarella glacialis TaxID=89957 RepID=A0A813KZE1_POLGL|nr:unnamed protein product [Polarella glacialis]
MRRGEHRGCCWQPNTVQVAIVRARSRLHDAAVLLQSHAMYLAHHDGAQWDGTAKRESLPSREELKYHKSHFVYALLPEVARHFQEWQSGGPARVKVSARVVVISVDFKKMTSLVDGSSPDALGSWTEIPAGQVRCLGF